MAHVDHPYGGEGAPPHADTVLAELAGRQAGVVGRWQLLAEGVSPRALERRLASGHLHLVHRGVYAVGHPAVHGRGLRFAAWLAAGAGAAISHRSAADELGIRTDSRRTVDVTTTWHARTRDGVVVHQAPLGAPDVTLIDGLPVTSVPRTLLDLATLLAEKDLTRALERADKLRVYDHRAIEDVIARNNGHRGVGRLRRAANGIDPRHDATRSDWERDVLPLLGDLGLPPAIVNWRRGPYEFDLAWPDHQLVVELDSFAHHGDRAAFEADRARDRWLAARRITCLRFTWRQVEEGALAELAGLLRVPPR